MKQIDITSVMDLIQLISVPSFLSCHTGSSVLVPADDRSWLQVDLSQQKPVLLNSYIYPVPVALVILCRGQYGSDRSDWRISDRPSQVGRVFCLIRKSLLCSNCSDHLHEK